MELSRSKLANEGGVNLDTVRYYERRGLLPKPPRTPAGYRVFTGDHVRRLRFIKHAQALGFSLKEVQDLLALRVRPGVSCADVCRQAKAKVADLDEKLRVLRAMRKELMRLVEACADRGPVSACVILASLDDNRRTPESSRGKGARPHHTKGGERR